MRRTLLLPVVCALVLTAFSAATAAPPSQEAWRAEFDDLCSKTDDATSLSKEELKALIERCDRLKPEIEKLDESPRKLYSKRLQMCRDLFAYVLETKEQEEK